MQIQLFSILITIAKAFSVNHIHFSNILEKNEIFF
jgi:hypothetical protein